jgi:RNA polymerase sigma factor (sigma-70 family)
MNALELRAQLEQLHAASYGWALSCCGGDSVEAEEVLQTAYLNVLQGRARFGGQAAFRTWLFAVIRRTAAGSRRRRWFEVLGLVRYGKTHSSTRSGEQPSDRIERSEMEAAFQATLSRLARRQREVLHLVFYQDLTLEEAASVMGVSVGAARQHYARGKRRFRECLEESEDYQWVTGTTR